MKWQPIIAYMEVYRSAMIVFQLLYSGMVNKNKAVFLVQSRTGTTEVAKHQENF